MKALFHALKPSSSSSQHNTTQGREMSTMRSRTRPPKTDSGGSELGSARFAGVAQHHRSGVAFERSQSYCHLIRFSNAI
jgi:hypothetical protein